MSSLLTNRSISLPARASALVPSLSPGISSTRAPVMALLGLSSVISSGARSIPALASFSMAPYCPGGPVIITAGVLDVFPSLTAARPVPFLPADPGGERLSLFRSLLLQGRLHRSLAPIVEARSSSLLVGLPPLPRCPVGRWYSALPGPLFSAPDLPPDRQSSLSQRAVASYPEVVGRRGARSSVPHHPPVSPSLPSCPWWLGRGLRLSPLLVVPPRPSPQVPILSGPR